MNLSFPLIPNIKLFILSLINLKTFLLLFFLLIFGCSSSKRFSDNNEFDSEIVNSIKVLLKEESEELIIKVDADLNLSDQSKILAKIKSGNKLIFSINSENLLLKIANKEFDSEVFFLKPIDEAGIISINGNKYRGRLKIQLYNSQIKLINQVNLEDYVKGVMIKEMPLGKGNENYEALKAFSICARTYAFNKVKEDKYFFDIYPDTRDQVYGGLSGETNTTNAIVDETRGKLLFYDNESAVMFYHSTCGGKTEDIKNVFTTRSIPYLNGVKDGSEPYCKISPRYDWTEKYSFRVIIDRLFDAKLIESKLYDLKEVKVVSRFDSGRVNELKFILVEGNGNKKEVSLFGNRMRNIIRSSDGKSILKSILFDIELDSG